MTWRAPTEGRTMKIKVVKKATKTAKPLNWCPTIVDDIDNGAAQK